MTFPTVPVTRVRSVPDGTDAYGNPKHKDESTPLPAALFDPGSSREVNGQVVVTTPAVYWADEWPDVTEHDRLTVGGTTWQVDGRPERWEDGGLVVRLRRAA